MWTLLGIISLAVLLLLLLYLPPVQDFAFPRVLSAISTPGQMEISAKGLRLKFPLHLLVDSARFYTPGMEVAAGHGDLKVALTPLFTGEIVAEKADVSTTAFRLGTPDSTLYMTAQVRSAILTQARVNLAAQRVIINDIAIDSGDVAMDMRPDTVPPPVKTDTVPVNWHITLNRATLTRIGYTMQMPPTITDLSCRIGTGEILSADVDMRYNTVDVRRLAITRADAAYIYPAPPSAAAPSAAAPSAASAQPVSASQASASASQASAGRTVLRAHARSEAAPAQPSPKASATEAAPTVPWTITCDQIVLTESQALYAMEGAHPLSPAFDLNYIKASEIEIRIDSFLSRGTTLRAPIRRISARERCGVPLELHGLFVMDSTALRATDMELTTPSSTISLTAMIGLAADSTAAKKPLPFSARLAATISHDDICRLAPLPVQPIAQGLPTGVPLTLDVDARGTTADIDINRIALRIPRHIDLSLRGRVANPTDVARASGQLTLRGSMPNGQFIKSSLLDARMAKQVNLPPITLDGDVTLNRGDISANLDATTTDGAVTLSADWQNRIKGYGLTFNADKFPLQAILPALGITDITASANIDGEGLDPFSPATRLVGDINLEHLGYHGIPYSNITARLDLADGNASLAASSDNPGARLKVNAAGNLAGDTLRWKLDGNFRDIDLQTLHLSDSVGEGSAQLSATAAFTLPKTRTVRVGRRRVKQTTPMSVNADLDIKSLYWRMASGTVNADNILAHILTDADTTALDLDNGDLCLLATSPRGIDSLLTAMTNTSTMLCRFTLQRQIAVDSLQRALPPFTLTARAGRNNILSSFLYDSEITFDSLAIAASNDSLISASALLRKLEVGKNTLDSIDLTIRQRGNMLIYDATLNNKPGTFDQFAHVDLRGFVGKDKFSMIFRQRNIEDVTGFSFGSVVTMPEENTFRLSFVPYHPVIGYKDWEINHNNFISYNIKDGRIRADIDLHSATSTLRLFTAPADSPASSEALASSESGSPSSASESSSSLASEGSPSLASSESSTVLRAYARSEAAPGSEAPAGSTAQETLHLKLTDIKLQDWIAINPFAPPMQGDLSADMVLQFADGFKNIDGDGQLSLHNFLYGREKVGDFDAAVNLSTNASGVIRANTSLMVNGVKTITASGNLNDSVAAHPFALDLRMIHFPLSVVNPFMPRGTARLHGMLDGTMEVTGKPSEPLLNGWVRFDSTRVNVDMLGSTLDFDTVRIPVVDNLITFDQFDIKAVNDNPLTIDGTVDISNLAAANLNLSMTAHNTQLVGSKRKREQDVYGKAYIDLDAKVRGDLSRWFSVTGKLDVLPGTNATYVIPDAQSAIASRTNRQMVHFVNFTDTAQVAQADSITREGVAMNLDLTLNLSEGSTLAVDLSADGKNRAQLQPSGSLHYSLDYLGDERVTGRINLNDGFVRYGMPPVMSEKTFNFREGSYVVFNGQMLDPTLNIHAFDEVKANVNDNGNSRQVNFDVGLNVTGSLDQMNVVFDLSTNSDITVQNELQAMSPDQRANQAMNLLLYGQYTGPGTKASTMGNPLYTFLEGQLNSLASSAIKGVDVSFGIDQLDRNRDGVSSTAMQYSYRVSKSLFDDRFKIIVGGNYTTDASADENFAQNLIADISFEYLLNKQGTMYVRLFRHTGYESILEGEITQTGVGFVYRKKIRTLRDIFRSSRKSQAAIKNQAAIKPDEPSAAQPEKEEATK